MDGGWPKDARKHFLHRSWPVFDKMDWLFIECSWFHLCFCPATTYTRTHASTHTGPALEIINTTSLYELFSIYYVTLAIARRCSDWEIKIIADLNGMNPKRSGWCHTSYKTALLSWGQLYCRMGPAPRLWGGSVHNLFPPFFHSLILEEKGYPAPCLLHELQNGICVALFTTTIRHTHSENRFLQKMIVNNNP